MALPLFYSWDLHPGKEVVAMTCQLILNWKSFAAMGVAVTAIILATKLMPDQSERVLTFMVDTFRKVNVSDDED